MSTISFITVPLERAAWTEPRIVVAKVLGWGQASVEGRPFAFLRLQALRTLKGRPGAEFLVFSAADWHRHTHADVLDVQSWAEFHYATPVPNDEIREGLELVVFLSDDPVPPGFPPGAVFMKLGEGYERAEREKDVVQALRDGPYGDFNHRIVLKIGDRIRLPGGMEIRLDAHSHKRPMTGGPQSEGSHLTVSHDGKSETLQLNHTVEPDGKQSWSTQTWGSCAFELRGMVYDQESTLVVWRR